MPSLDFEASEGKYVLGYADEGCTGGELSYTFNQAPDDFPLSTSCFYSTSSYYSNRRAFLKFEFGTQLSSISNLSITSIQLILNTNATCWLNSLPPADLDSYFTNFAATNTSDPATCYIEIEDTSFGNADMHAVGQNTATLNSAASQQVVTNSLSWLGIGITLDEAAAVSNPDTYYNIDFANMQSATPPILRVNYSARRRRSSLIIL